MATADLYHLGQVKGTQWSPWSSGCKRSGGLPPLALGGLVREDKSWRARMDIAADGTYEIPLMGPQGDQLFIRYRPVDEFDRRMFLILLRHVWTLEDTPKRPFLRQE